MRDTITDWQPTDFKLGIATDHGAYDLKNEIISRFQDRVRIYDYGAHELDPADDYPDFACGLARGVARQQIHAGILLCRSGVGMSIAANRFHCVRAALAENAEKARLSREHNAANILVTGGDGIDKQQVFDIVETWLNTPYSNDSRHTRRLIKLEHLSHEQTALLQQTDPEVGDCIAAQTDNVAQALPIHPEINYVSPAAKAAEGASHISDNRVCSSTGDRDSPQAQLQELAVNRTQKLFGLSPSALLPYPITPAELLHNIGFLQEDDAIVECVAGYPRESHTWTDASLQTKPVTRVTCPPTSDSPGIPDFTPLSSALKKHAPKILVLHWGLLSRHWPFETIKELTQQHGTLLAIDAGAYTGSIASRHAPNPCDVADLTILPTDGTLGGMSSTLVLTNHHQIDKLLVSNYSYLRQQRNVAATAVCLREALKEEFKEFQEGMIKNARTLADTLREKNFDIMPQRPDTHLCFVALRGESANIEKTKEELAASHLTVPLLQTADGADTTIAILGTQAITERGLQQKDVTAIGEYFASVVQGASDTDKHRELGEKIRAMTADHPPPAFTCFQ